MKNCVIFLCIAMISLSCGKINITEPEAASPTMATGKEKLKIKECSKLSSDEKSFNQNSPSLYTYLFSAAVKNNRISFNKVEGNCTDFFDYLYSNVTGLIGMKIFTAIFPKIPFEFDTSIYNHRPIVISFASMDKDKAFHFSYGEKNDDLIINSNYRFEDDGGKNFLKLISILSSELKLINNSTTEQSFSVEFDESSYNDIHGNEGLALIKIAAETFKSNPEIFEIYNSRQMKMHILLRPYAISEGPLASNVVGCTQENIYSVNFKYTQCSFYLHIDALLKNEKLSCAIKHVINQNDFGMERGQYLNEYYFNMDLYCR